MTLADALRRLHAARRIASPWLPGMLLEELATPGNARWRHPMRLTEGWPEPDVDRARVVLADPATVGCLLALLREATSNPLAHAACVRGRWEVRPRRPFQAWHASEPEAIAAALIQLASEVTP